MNKPPRVTKHNLGAEPTVESILEFADWIKNIPGKTRVSFSQEFGQRDQEYTFVTITETDW